jgi:hypothetical protein
MHQSSTRTEGSVLIWTVLTISILSLILGEAVRVVSVKYQNALQSTQWQDALLGAESGIDLAIVELRKGLYPASIYGNMPPFPTASATPAGSWDGVPTADGSTGGHETVTIPSAGLAGTSVTVDVKVDKPGQLVDHSNNDQQYYRIRSTGTLPLTGPPRVSDNKYDSNLRKLSLQWNRFTGAYGAPQVSRTIEAVVKPTTSFDLAILSMSQLNLTDQNIVIDSYDSRSDAKSTNGLYDVAKRQQHGNIATDGNLINAGNAQIYGDVATNSGTVTGTAGITGQQRTDFYQDAISVGTPSGFPTTATVVDRNTTLTGAGGTQQSPVRYTVSNVALNGNGNLILGDASGGNIEIYVTGSISVTGNSQITLSPNVKVKIYFAGDVSIAGNGIVNSNNQPGDLQLYGIKPPDNVSQTVSLGGNAQLTAAVYAPDADISVNGGGSTGHVFGSFVGKTVVMNGVTNLHYDEALGIGGPVTNYKIVSWFEDNR